MKNRKSTLKEKAVLLGVPAIGAAVAVYKKNQARTQIYKDLLKNEEAKQKDKDNSGKKNSAKKRILITGQGSYIGESVEKWLVRFPESYDEIGRAHV